MTHCNLPVKREKHEEINALLLSHEGRTRLKVRRINSKRCHPIIQTGEINIGTELLYIDRETSRTAHQAAVILRVKTALKKMKIKFNKFER